MRRPGLAPSRSNTCSIFALPAGTTPSMNSAHHQQPPIEFSVDMETSSADGSWTTVSMSPDIRTQHGCRASLVSESSATDSNPNHLARKSCSGSWNRSASVPILIKTCCQIERAAPDWRLLSMVDLQMNYSATTEGAGCHLALQQMPTLTSLAPRERFHPKRKDRHEYKIMASSQFHTAGNRLETTPTNPLFSTAPISLISYINNLLLLLWPASRPTETL